MIDFKNITLSDKPWISKLFNESSYIGSENAFGSMFIWGSVFDLKVSKYKSCLLRRYGENDYAIPIGPESPKKVIKDLKISSLISLTEPMIEKIGDDFEIFSQRNSWDYIYKSTDLANLSGKKYHGKRNHISKFKKTYNWTYEKISDKNLNECIKLADKWYLKNKDKNNINKEKSALKITFDNFFELDFIGGLIKVEGQPVAFTIGEKINKDVFVIHFEKALSEFDGSYAIINNEFVKNELLKYKLINREEDMGLLGLRKSKLSYHPYILLEKFNGKLKEHLKC